MFGATTRGGCSCCAVVRSAKRRRTSGGLSRVCPSATQTLTKASPGITWVLRCNTKRDSPTHVPLSTKRHGTTPGSRPLTTRWLRSTASKATLSYPGLGAEERGQAEAIAHNLREMARLKVPFIAAITGEGGSGGALAIAVADRVLMLENSIYSVISPEGCASIMWRDSNKKDIAAQALRITAKDNLEMGFCDEVIPEPAGGAHHDYDAAAKLLADALEKNLSELEKLPIPALLDARYNKFRNMAQFFEVVGTPA